MATVFMSVTTRLSDLADQKPGINIQTEGHTLISPSSQKALKTQRYLGTPHDVHLSWSAARTQTPDWSETQYCLEIHVTSTEDERVTPPPPHAWQVPIVEDMVQDGKAGLTEAVVTGPGQAILFYGQWSSGEGLSLGEVWDATFTLSGAISWVGKQAQLSAKPVSLGNIWRLIAQAIIEGHIVPKELCHPFPPHLHQHHPISIIKTCLHDQPTSQQQLDDGRCPGLALDQYFRSKVRCHSKAGTETRDNENYGRLHPSHLCSHQIMNLKVTEVQHQLLHQWHQCLRDWKVLGIHAMADSPIGNPKAIWRYICWSSKDKDTKDTITYQSWCWDLTMYHHTGCQDCTLLPYIIHSFTRLPGGVGEEFGDWHHPEWCPYHSRWSLQQCQGLGCFEPRTLSAMHGW